MITSPACLDLSRWRELFEGRLSPEERAAHELHLESCARCQELLDSAPDECFELRRIGRQVAERTTVAEADATLVDVVRRLLEGTTAARPAAVAELHFLRPADRPGVLGMLGDYEVRAVIGQGGMGIVLRAFDRGLQRLVAIKVMAPSLAGSTTARQRFIREAQAAASVVHEHVVAIHGVQDALGLPYLVMQHIAGASLQDCLDRGAALPIVQIVRIGREAASGLAVAHAQGLIHRDIKPANILLQRSEVRSQRSEVNDPKSDDGLSDLWPLTSDLWCVKITDFGLARSLDDSRLTQQGVVAGTPAYMAPEQARGEALDHRADLFSLGSVLYALAAGRPPFHGSSAVAVLRQVSDQPPPPLRSLNPRVPDWFEAIVMRLMANDPGQRFQSAAEVARHLEGCLAHLREPAQHALPVLAQQGVSASTRGRRARRLAAAACLMLALVGGGGLLLQQAEPPAQKPQAFEFYQDFRGAQLPLAKLVPLGPNAKADMTFAEDGARIRLAASRPTKSGVGLATKFPISGDFELTASFEILEGGRPKEGMPLGVALTVQTDVRQTRLARVARYWHPKAGSVFWAEALDKTFNPVAVRIATRPTETRSGRLRLERQGAIMKFLAAEGENEEFQEVLRQDFGTHDILGVLLDANNYDMPLALDVRLIDFRVRAAGSTFDETKVPPLPPPAAAAPPTRGRLIAVIAGLATLLAASACAYFLRRRRQQAQAARSARRERGTQT